MSKKKDLSPVEVRVMNKLCELGEADIGTVQESFSVEKGWKYTTVLTIFQRLFEKKYLKRKKEGRKFIYRPIYTSGQLFKIYINRFFGKAFEKNPAPLVEYLLETKVLNQNEKKVLEKALNRLNAE